MTLRELVRMVEAEDPAFLDVPLQYRLQDGSNMASLTMPFADEVGYGWWRCKAESDPNHKGWLTLTFAIIGGYKLVRRSK